MLQPLMQNKYIKCASINLLFQLILTCCTFFLAQYLASFLNVVRTSSEFNILKLVFPICFVLLIQLVVGFLRNRYWKEYRSTLTNQQECSLYERYLLSSSFLEKESELSTVCDKDIKECETFYTETIPNFIQAIIGFLLYSIYFLSKTDGIILYLILLLLSLFQFLPPVIVQKYLIQNYIRAGQEEASLRQQILTGLQGITTIKMLNLEQWFFEAFCRKQREFQKTGERAAATSSVQSALNSGVSLLQQVGLLIVGICGVVWGWFSLETLIEGYIISSSFNLYSASLGAFKTKRGICTAAEKRIRTICETPSRVQGIKADKPTITLPENGCWIIQGDNGAGKSTFLAVLMGYLPCDVPIVWKNQEVDNKKLNAMTSWCPQMYLNLSLSFRSVSELIPNDIIDVKKLKYTLSKFDVNDHLLDKPLNQLSGGEQKKIVISLALAKKCEILLLDEPEVSLDNASIEIFKELLSEEERLVLMITHNSIFNEISGGSILVKEGIVNV